MIQVILLILGIACILLGILLRPLSSFPIVSSLGIEFKVDSSDAHKISPIEKNLDTKTSELRSVQSREEQHHSSLSIIIMGCTTIPKYLQQLVDCSHSWMVDAEAAGIRVRIMVGDISDKTPPELMKYIVPLHCGDDYASATQKHWVGLEHMYLNCPATDWYYVCGSDTYLNVDHALGLLDSLDTTKALYVGGHGDVRTWKKKSYYFHSGGPGYMFSRAAMDRIVPEIPDILANYFTKSSVPEAFKMCDVQAGYVVKRLCIDTVQVENKFYHCNFSGQPCHTDKPPNPDTFVACHMISHEDFVQRYKKHKGFDEI